MAVGKRFKGFWLVPAAILAALVGVVQVPALGAGTPTGPNCSRTSTGLTAITDLDAKTYRGYQGGLYPGGSDVAPAAYLNQGLASANLVKPLTRNGAVAPTGQIVLLSIGMSNALREFAAFQNAVWTDNTTNRRLVTVNGAEVGQDAEIIKDPNATYWSGVDARLNAAGVTSTQVEVVWLKEAIGYETSAFPQDALRLKTDLNEIVNILTGRFPHLRLVYVSSRTYGGYASIALSPEPFAYEGGFAVKWLIQDRIKANTTQPWVAWGPYLWTDGLRGRSDGLVWSCNDVITDGTHPSPTGRQKVVDLLVRFFKTDPTARSWFLANP